jgi:hypothetical protein
MVSIDYRLSIVGSAFIERCERGLKNGCIEENTLCNKSRGKAADLNVKSCRMQ